MGEQLVTVAHFGKLWEAELLRGHLRAHGIESLVQGGHLATAQSLPAWTWVGVQVQVFSGDVPAAVRLVAEHDAGHVARGGQPPADACLACGTPLPESARECPACHWTWELRGHRAS